MHPYAEMARKLRTPRSVVFERMHEVLDQEAFPYICEIGGTRPNFNAPDFCIAGDGASSIYWCEYLKKRGTGKLRIVDIDPIAISSTRLVLQEYIDQGVNIELTVGDGMDWVGKEPYSLVYLDGPDNDNITYEMFRKVDNTKTAVLCDDANFNQFARGKCLRLRYSYPCHYLFRFDSTPHEMIFYPKMVSQSSTFKVGGLVCCYCRDTYNRAFENERSVEVSLGAWFVNRFGSDNVVEIGCVLPYYQIDRHTIVDISDTHPRSIKANALDLNYKGKSVVCISTIEHLNAQEYNNGSDQDAIRLLLKIVSEADAYLITIPVGYHKVLDAYLKKHQNPPRTFLRRINWANEWEQSETECWDAVFGHRDGREEEGLYNNANALCLVTNCYEILANPNHPGTSQGH